jgi:hypothetical protein
VSWEDDQRREDEERAAAKPQLREGHVELNAGDHCPLCQVGVLYEIASGEDSVLLRCFNCNRQASHRPSVGHKTVVTSPRETPTGFTLSRAQHAAMNAADPEEEAAAHLTLEHGSGATVQREGYEGA